MGTGKAALFVKGPGQWPDGSALQYCLVIPPLTGGSDRCVMVTLLREAEASLEHRSAGSGEVGAHSLESHPLQHPQG